MTNATSKKPSAMSWSLIHVFLPLMPFLIEGLIRFIILDRPFDLHTFSSTTLAASITLLCLFLNQHLLAHNIPLPDECEQSRLYGTATWFLTFAMISLILFAVIVTLTAINEEYNDLLKNKVYIFEYIVFIFWVVPIIIAIQTQRSYKLRAVI